VPIDLCTVRAGQSCRFAVLSRLSTNGGNLREASVVMAQKGGETIGGGTLLSPSRDRTSKPHRTGPQQSARVALRKSRSRVRVAHPRKGNGAGAMATGDEAIRVAAASPLADGAEGRCFVHFEASLGLDGSHVGTAFPKCLGESEVFFRCCIHRSRNPPRIMNGPTVA
jgi:hypothetical protein